MGFVNASSKGSGELANIPSLIVPKLRKYLQK